jgi:hypothetical protein
VYSIPYTASLFTENLTILAMSTVDVMISVFNKGDIHQEVRDGGKL